MEFDITINSKTKMPEYALDSAGYDIFTPETIDLYPDECVTIDTGIAIHINKKDVGLLILPKSGLGSRGLCITNTVGLIDYGYTGNIIIKLKNNGRRPINILAGKAFVQGVFVPIYHPVLKQVDSHKETDRGSGGFGHTNA